MVSPRYTGYARAEAGEGARAVVGAERRDRGGDGGESACPTK